MSLSIYHSHTHSVAAHNWEREEAGTRERETTVVRKSYLYLWFLLLVLILSLRKLRGFLLYGFPEENLCVHCLLWFIVVLVILLDKILISYSLNDKNLTKVANCKLIAALSVVCFCTCSILGVKYILAVGFSVVCRYLYLLDGFQGF